jgi:hypothetical protein
MKLGGYLIQTSRQHHYQEMDLPELVWSPSLERACDRTSHRDPDATRGKQSLAAIHKSEVNLIK